MNTRAVAQFDLACEAIETVRLKASRSQTGRLISACESPYVTTVADAAYRLLQWADKHEQAAEAADSADADDWTTIAMQADLMHTAAEERGDTSDVQRRVWIATDALERIVRRALKL